MGELDIRESLLSPAYFPLGIMRRGCLEALLLPWQRCQAPTAGKGTDTRVCGDALVSVDLEQFWDAFGQEWLSWGAACTDSKGPVPKSRIWKGGRRGWEGCLDWLGLHPFLSLSRTPQYLLWGLDSLRVINFLCLILLIKKICGPWWSFGHMGVHSNTVPWGCG